MFVWTALFVATAILAVACKSPNTSTSQTLDHGVSPTGQPLFVWPKDHDHRNYDRLAELMTEYASLTGNCLNKDAIGPGEVAFKTELESRRKIVRQAFKTGGVTKGCASYKENFIDKTYNGSPFAQYGYCNESSYTALCLATQAGFKENEILKCDTMHYTNDHTFTMVSRPGQKWCVMDRYDLKEISFVMPIGQRDQNFFLSMVKLPVIVGIKGSCVVRLISGLSCKSTY
jgi:hypothetical protein